MKVLDTYALIEVIENNPKFMFLLDKAFIITDLTLAEFWAVLYRDSEEEVANYWFKKFLPFTKATDIEIFKEAYKFKIDNKKRKLSLVDCVGYIYSKSKNLKFVTGDKEFKALPLVEFIK